MKPTLLLIFTFIYTTVGQDYFEYSRVPTTSLPYPDAEVPMVFRADGFFYLNAFGNCPGNFLDNIQAEGITVGNLDECMAQCSRNDLCLSVAVRFRDLPKILPNGDVSSDSVKRCWLKTVANCHSDFTPIGNKIEATMLVKRKKDQLITLDNHHYLPSLSLRCIKAFES